jgi:hypothetical protein
VTASFSRLSGSALHHLDAPVSVAVVAVWVVQRPVYQVVGVIPVRNRLVTAVGTVTVVAIVAVGEPRSALRRVPVVHRELVLVHVVTVRVVQAAVVKVICMAVVPDRRVTTSRPVIVVVPFVSPVVVRHTAPSRTWESN